VALGHASLVGSSLAGESIASGLATTAGSLDGAPWLDAATVATPDSPALPPATAPCLLPPRGAGGADLHRGGADLQRRGADLQRGGV
jgi:hypothetical protein